MCDNWVSMDQLTLPQPTVEDVQAACDEFDKENALVEDAIRQLREHFPRNVEVSQVLLKVLVLNKLYSAFVRDIDIEPMARHIAGLNLDPLLADGSPNAVGLITKCGLPRRYFAFATKFCTWHNPNAYAIYDSAVDKCLWRYKKKDHFATFKRQDLRSYPNFLAMVTTFRNVYGLTSFTLRQIDKFLVQWGYRLQALASRKG